MKWQWIRRLVNFWPPLFFTGIKATHISTDFRHIEVVLKLRWHNRNFVGTQFGGSLFAMTDPWYMLMLAHNLGPDYFVWDKSAHIDFIAPGRSAVRATFRLDDATLERIHEHTAEGKKYLPNFAIDITDREGHLVATIHRTVYVRRKPHKRQTNSSPNG